MSVLRSQPLPSPRETTPPLENGDHLNRDEFERRYHAMPHVKKAELIEGIVYMPSPLRFRKHGRPSILLATWIGHYALKTPGIEDFGENCTLRLDDENEPQPDLVMRLPETAGGRSRISEDDYLEGPAEFVVEVAASSVSLDMHAKLRVYQSHGLQEYLVWRVLDEAVSWFALHDGKYREIPPDERGILRSEVFPGLWLDVAALLARDLVRLLGTLDESTATPEHAVFVERLRAGRGPDILPP